MAENTDTAGSEVACDGLVSTTSHEDSDQPGDADSVENTRHGVTNDEAAQAAEPSPELCSADAGEQPLIDKHLLEWIEAASHGNTTRLESLLDSGTVTVDARHPLKTIGSYSFEGSTALTYACENSQVTAAKLLLQRGADVNMAGCLMKDTALHRLIHIGCRNRTLSSGAANLELASLLLDQGADPNFQDICGQIPLHWASLMKLPDMVRLLIERGSDVNLLTQKGQSVLHRCFSSWCRSRVMEENALCCAKILVDAGVDVDAVNAWRETALTLAIKYRYKQGANFLLMQNCNPNLPALPSSLRQPEAVTEIPQDATSLFEIGSDPDSQNTQSADSPFLTCVQAGDLKLLEFLLMAGCAVEDFSAMTSQEEIKAQVQVLVSIPRTLMESCRIVIRRALRCGGAVGPRFMDSVEMLSIPEGMREFLLFRDINPVPCSIS